MIANRLHPMVPLAWRALVIAGALAAPATPRAATPESSPTYTEVKVERTRPHKEKLPTLQFLRANRDFIRARFDQLLETPMTRRGRSTDIDPRFLVYSELLAEAQAAQDSVAGAEDERSRRHLIESIAQLGTLEAQLDMVERSLALQNVRLATLEADFTGRQQTTLMVVLKGYPTDATVAEVALTIDDGETVRIALSPEQRESLRHGGMLEILHRAVEPREQVVQVTMSGETWPAGDSGFLTLEPLRDRLTFLRLDLSAVHPAQGGASIQASTWLHEAPIHSSDG